MMTTAKTYTVAEVMDGVTVGPTLFRVVGLCFLLMVCDSYDVSALSYAAPTLIRDWRISPGSMGLIFGVGLSGLLVGSIVLGQLGDRIGRKKSIVLGALAFSLLTAATGLAQSGWQLAGLRFVAALGLGGAVPNAVALCGEFSPVRLRATTVGVIFAGYSIGGIVAGIVAASAVPAWGWSSLFFIGGALSTATTLLLAKLLPESLNVTSRTPGRSTEATRLASKLRPDLQIGQGAIIVPDDGSAKPGTRLTDLFAGRLAVATPLMWAIYVASSLTIFSLVSWLPAAVEAIGLSRSSSAVALALLFMGSAIGGIVGGRMLDRFGLPAIVGMALAAIPAVSGIGTFAAGETALMLTSLLAGCFAFGTQTSLHGFVATLYPAEVRAAGVGWAIGVAKLGSIAGPIIGGSLLGRVSSAALFIAAATPMAVVVLLALVLHAHLAAWHKRSAPSTGSATA